MNDEKVPTYKVDWEKVLKVGPLRIKACAAIGGNLRGAPGLEHPLGFWKGVPGTP